MAALIKISKNFLRAARANRKVVSVQEEQMYYHQYSKTDYVFESGYMVSAEATPRGYICQIFKNGDEIAYGWFYVSRRTGNTHVELIPAVGYFNVGLGPCREAVYDAVTALGESNYRDYTREPGAGSHKRTSEYTDGELVETEGRAVTVWDDPDPRSPKETEDVTVLGEGIVLTEKRKYTRHSSEWVRKGHFHRYRGGHIHWVDEKPCHPKH